MKPTPDRRSNGPADMEGSAPEIHHASMLGKLMPALKEPNMCVSVGFVSSCYMLKHVETI